MESIMLLLFQRSWPTNFLLFWSFLNCIIFWTYIPFCPHLFLRLLNLWVWYSMLILMFILMLLLIVPEALCLYVLAYNILVLKLNKIFNIITQTIKILHGIYFIVFKNMCFWCETKSKLAPGLHGGSNKSSYLSDTLTGWVNLRSAWEGTINPTERFCTGYAYLFDIFTSDLASTAIFQQNKKLCIISSESATIRLTHIPLI